MSTTHITASNKTALVTGGARRIGRAIALALAQRGWDVAVHYARSAVEAQATVQEIEALGRRAVALHCELDDETAVKSLLTQASKALGAISCVVNNASLFDSADARPFSSASLASHMKVNENGKG